jgi:superfamily I DNA/RNA helicase
VSFEPSFEQRRAIEAPLGPVLVVAGPGAGKTFCLIGRINHLIGQLGLDPRRILAVTFTNKAAEEIATRLHRTRGPVALDICRGTLHSTCLQILRDFAEGCGLRSGFGVADREYQLSVLKRLRIPERGRARALELFSLYRLQGRPLTDGGKEFLARYQERLRARNLVDFDDLVALTEELLRTNDTAAIQLRRRWDYVLVDEFQDLNAAQYSIVRRLTDDHRNLFGVGDDEQSIFAWAGSDPRIIQRFREDFSVGEPIVLDVNRRCSIQIFEAARRLINHNSERIEKRIYATRDSTFEVQVELFDNDEDETEWLIRDIMADRSAGGPHWGEYAILYRSHKIGERLEDRLVSAGIPCRLAHGHALGDDKVIGWVTASLKVIRYPDDPVLLEAMAKRALSAALCQEIRRASSKERDLLGNLRAFAARRPKGDGDRRLIRRLIYHLENLRAVGKSHQTLSGIVDELLARPIGAGSNPLDEHRDDLSDPCTYPGAAFLAKQLRQALAAGSPVWVEPSLGLEMPLTAMLRSAGVSQARRVGDNDRPAPSDVVLRPEHGAGWPLRLFKTLQLLQTETLKSDLEDFVAFDLETSSFSVQSCEIVEIAAVRVRGNTIVEGFRRLVACERPISADATRVHGYVDADVADAPSLAEVWPLFRDFAGSDVLVAHNGQMFDVPVLRRTCAGFSGLDDLVFYDTVPLARSLVTGSVRLEYLAQKFNVEVGRTHHALDDAMMLAGVVPALNELRLRRARKISLVHLLDYLGLALSLDRSSESSKEELLFRELTRPYTLGRYSDCLEAYGAELISRLPGAPSLDEVVDRLGGQALMARMRAERSADERYPSAVERLRRLVEGSKGTTVEQQIDDLLCQVALSTSTEAEPDPDRLNLLTLHSTKGLEFSRVYFIGLEDQQLPGWKSLEEDNQEEIQEARRLCYVGMTRAKDRLVLTRTQRRAGISSGGSLFLIEAGLAPTD